MIYEIGKIYMTSDPNNALFYKATQVYPELTIFERVGDGTQNTNRAVEFTDAVNPFLITATTEALELQKSKYERDVALHQANLDAANDYLTEFNNAIAAVPVEPAPEPTDPAPTEPTA